MKPYIIATILIIGFAGATVPFCGIRGEAAINICPWCDEEYSTNPECSLCNPEILENHYGTEAHSYKEKDIEEIVDLVKWQRIVEQQLAELKAEIAELRKMVRPSNTNRKIDYKVGDKVRTIPEYTNGSSGRSPGKYFEGYVLNIFETPDNTWVEPGHTIFLVVVNSSGSVYCSGTTVKSVHWFRKFDKERDPPSYFWAADEYRETGILPKPK